jgi:PiT family inorganic phosphate transporter
VPFWVILPAHAALVWERFTGGWRIVKTMGMRIPLRRWAASARNGGGDHPARYSHRRHSGQHDPDDQRSIMGVGAIQRLSAVRWGVAGKILWAWILTIPASAMVAAATWFLLHLVGV